MSDMFRPPDSGRTSKEFNRVADPKTATERRETAHRETARNKVDDHAPAPGMRPKPPGSVGPAVDRQAFIERQERLRRQVQERSQAERQSPDQKSPGQQSPDRRSLRDRFNEQSRKRDGKDGPAKDGPSRR